MKHSPPKEENKRRVKAKRKTSLALSSLSCLSNLPNNVSLCSAHVLIAGTDKQIAKRTHSSAATGKDGPSYHFHFIKYPLFLFLVCWKSGSSKSHFCFKATP